MIGSKSGSKSGSTSATSRRDDAHRAVITGVGCVSGLGIGWPAFVAALRAGHSAIAPLTVLDASTFPCVVGGEVAVHRGEAAERGFWARHGGGLRRDALEALHAAGAMRDRKLVFALMAADEAWRSAGCGGAHGGDAWLTLGIGVENAFFEDAVPLLAERDGKPWLDWRREAALELPAYRLRSPLDRTAEAVAEALGLGGPVVLHSSACAAGALSVAHAASLIQRGLAQTVLAGAADSMLNPCGFGGMAQLGATSPRAAADACRPFDRRRDGTAIGEGAALFVVESLATARARGATILAEIVGWGSSQDAYRPSAPQPGGASATAAMRAALHRAGLEPSRIGYLNAHGTGTTLNDVAEARAIREVFGPHTDVLPVSSIKGAAGHLMAASGAIELAASLSALRQGHLPGTCNLQQLDPECPIAALGPAGAVAEVEHVQSNSFGFGGQNASVILRRWA